LIQNIKRCVTLYANNTKIVRLRTRKHVICTGWFNTVVVCFQNAARGAAIAGDDISIIARLSYLYHAISTNSENQWRAAQKQNEAELPLFQKCRCHPKCQAFREHSLGDRRRVKEFSAPLALQMPIECISSIFLCHIAQQFTLPGAYSAPCKFCWACAHISSTLFQIRSSGS